jgi:nucleotide-binding universal stress UspA family protein
MYEHLLVPLDGSAAAERVLVHLEALAAAFGSKVTLLRATVSPEALLAQSTGAGPAAGDIGAVVDPTPIVDIDREAAEEYLAGIAARLRGHGVTVDTETPEGPAATEIVERAKALGVSLICMTTHGRSGLGRVLFGSTADSVLRHAECPVLLVRVTDEADGDGASG